MLAHSGNDKSPAPRQGLRTPSSAPPGLVDARIRQLASLVESRPSTGRRLHKTGEKRHDKYDQFGSPAEVVSSPTYKPSAMRPSLKTSRTGDGRASKTKLTAHNGVRMMPVTSDGASSSRASRSVGKGGSSSSLEGGRHEDLALVDLKSPSRQLVAEDREVSKEERIIRVCHSCGEDLSSRSRCNKCGHDFCNKCVIKITMDHPRPEAPQPSSSTSTIREPSKRNLAPETPKPRATETQVGAGVRNNPFFQEDQKTRALASEPRTVPFARTAVRTRQLSDCVPRRFMDRASSDGPEDEEEEDGRDGRHHQHSICCEARQRRAEIRSTGPETDVEDDDDRGSRKIRNLRLRAEELHVRQKKIRDEDEASIPEKEDVVDDDAASYSLRPRPHSLEEDERVPVDVRLRPHSLERDDVFVGFGGSETRDAASVESVVAIQDEEHDEETQPEMTTPAISSLTGFPQHRRGTQLCAPPQEAESWPRLHKVEKPMTETTTAEAQRPELEWRNKLRRASDVNDVERSNTTTTSTTPASQWRALLGKPKADATGGRRRRETCSFCEPEGGEGGRRVVGSGGVEG
ncbi:Zinc finger, RING/FYVE/PHD-type [Ophiocordyceps camponoti-floridani]|uniref:Zinc finger, RING/FYVE/PHD-type n=1 Tax=Ophiocordyceps camponoti-floridani TaxID=2030778 RepID=A0A8H4Q0Q8_9HYPO|nr:Zinc finger, RING/FYVE/PHD-type [Ophiocordyceps camponoti-floridani]